MKKSVHYLGHVVSSEGVETDPTKIRCIADWATPSNAKELKQFLGLASYYRRFVRGFAKIASPLHWLSEKNKPWAWTDECEQAFNLLKHHLISAPILKLPIFSQNFILDVDASENGLGAVLSQEVDGHEQVVAYGSRALTKAEKKYCATRKELLALVGECATFAHTCLVVCSLPELTTTLSSGFTTSRTLKDKLPAGWKH